MSHTVPTDDLPRPSPPRRWSGTVVAALLMAALLMTAMVVVSLAAMNRPPAATSRGVLDRARTAGSGGDWPAGGALLGGVKARVGGGPGRRGGAGPPEE